MLVTLSGSVMLVSLAQSVKARFATLATPSGISYAPEMPPGKQISVVFFLSKSTPLSSLEYAELSGSTHIPDSLAQPSNESLWMLVTLLGMAMLVRPVQPSNALPPMLVTLSGMVTFVRPVQPPNARPPMLVTLPGMVTFVRPEQSLNVS